MKLYDQIKQLLQTLPELRDSDRKLQWHLWMQQGLVRNNTITYEDFMAHNLLNSETIRRTRQKVQENFPFLQSSPGVQNMKNKKRKLKGTHVYRKQITYRFEGSQAIPIDNRN